MRFRWIPLIAVPLAGCGIIAGVDGDYFEVTDGGADAAVDKDGSGVGDGGQTGDGGFERCGNNGTCVTVPQGWTLVAYDNNRDTCPSSFPGSKDIVIAPTSNGCSCNCQTTSQGSCGGSANVTVYTGGSCSGDAGTANVNMTSQCTQSSALNNIGSARLGSLNPISPTCGAGSSQKSSTSDGRLCSPQSPPACTGGGVCAGSTSGSGYSVCLMQAGDVSCPGNGYDSKRLVGDSVASDTRTCGPCTCTPQAPSCSGAEIDFYAGGSCGGDAGVTIKPNNNCTSVSGSYGSYKWSGISSNGSCQASNPSVTGTLTLANVTTVCCRSQGGGGN